MKKREKKEIQEAELKAGLKDMSPLKKLEYFWMYDKWVIGLVIGLIVLAVGGYQWYDHSKVQEILSVAVVNCMLEDTDGMEEEIKEVLGAEGKYEDVVFNVSFTADAETGELEYYSQVAFFSQAAAGAIDVLLMPESVAENLDEVGYFEDLSTILGEDYAAVEKYAVGNCLDLSEFSLGEKYGLGDSVYFGVLVQSKQKENAGKYLLSLVE